MATKPPDCYWLLPLLALLPLRLLLFLDLLLLLVLQFSCRLLLFTQLIFSSRLNRIIAICSVVTDNLICRILLNYFSLSVIELLLYRVLKRVSQRGVFALP